MSRSYYARKAGRKKVPLPEAMSPTNVRDFCRGLVQYIIATPEWRRLHDFYEANYDVGDKNRLLDMADFIQWDDEVQEDDSDQSVEYTVSFEMYDHLMIRVRAEVEEYAKNTDEAHKLWMDMTADFSNYSSGSASTVLNLNSPDYATQLEGFKASMVAACVEALTDSQAMLEDA